LKRFSWYLESGHVIVPPAADGLARKQLTEAVIG